MSIRYTVRPCDNGDLPLVDWDGDEDDISEYIDQLGLQPRGRRPQNHTVLVRVCNNDTQLASTSGQNITNDKTEGTGNAGQPACQLKKVTVTPQDMVSQEGIPLDVLKKIKRDEESTVSRTGTEPGGNRGGRQRREAEGNWTDVVSSGALEDGGTGIEIVENRTDSGAEVKAEESSEMLSVNNGTKGGLEERNEISLNSNPLQNKKPSTVELNSEEMAQNYIQSEPERLKVELLDLENIVTADNNNTTKIDLSLEYDDYTEEVLFSVCVCLIYIH